MKSRLLFITLHSDFCTSYKSQTGNVSGLWEL